MNQVIGSVFSSPVLHLPWEWSILPKATNKQLWPELKPSPFYLALGFHASRHFIKNIIKLTLISLS